MAASVQTEISFRLNDQIVTLDEVSASQTLLDYLRLDKFLRGTKEGCAEGDCGACTVLIGRMVGDGLKYESVTACIRLLGSLHGCHVVTVEHLKGYDGDLHPVQRAMVDHHGSQCGFCTPGFVMSLYGLWLENPHPNRHEIEKSLQGNLCRCTGYAPIIKAAEAMAENGLPEDDCLMAERKEIIQCLKSLKTENRISMADQIIVPANLEDLARAIEDQPEATLVAGATDAGLWVTKFMRDISPAIFISHLEELQTIDSNANGVTLGAGVSYSDAYGPLVKHFPQLGPFWDRIGGEQVRNMGTVGGNIANGSPIGDTPPPLIVLGATLTLRGTSGNRTIPLEEFFIEYGKQDRAPGEFVEQVHIPALGKNDQFAVYKISKRRDEDISAVCGAFLLRLDEAGSVEAIKIAFGGMAGTPKRASNVEAALIGKPWNEETVAFAIEQFDQDYEPLSDWRASAKYRQQVAKNLLHRFYSETATPELLSSLPTMSAA